MHLNRLRPVRAHDPHSSRALIFFSSNSRSRYLSLQSSVLYLERMKSSARLLEDDGALSLRALIDYYMIICRIESKRRSKEATF
jgi:hypothetical protein